MSSEYFIKLDQFEGPLDLLLYLIREHEIDIFKIDIFQLAQQYLQYLRVVRFSDLNDAAGFVAMAANLLEIKTRHLLPNTKQQLQDQNEGLDDDPAMALQRRLIEYDRFQRAAQFFATSPQMGVQIQSNFEGLRLLDIYGSNTAPSRGDTAQLIAVFEMTLKDFVERKPGTVEAKTHLVTLEDTIERMCQFIEQVEFLLFQGMYAKFNSRYEFVVHILAILELCKSGFLSAHQEQLMGPLWVFLRSCSEEKLPFHEQNHQCGAGRSAEVAL